MVMDNKKNTLKAVAATVIFHGVFAWILIVFAFKPVQSMYPYPEGISIIFGDDVVLGEAVVGDDAAGDLNGGFIPEQIPDLTTTTPSTDNYATQTDMPSIALPVNNTPQVQTQPELSEAEKERIRKEEEFVRRAQALANQNLYGNGGTNTGNFGNSTTGAQSGMVGHPGGSISGTKTKGMPGNPLGNTDATHLVKPLNTINCDKQVELRLKIDSQGNVVDITDIETAISEQNCIEAAKRAARQNKFPADASQNVRYAHIIYDYTVSHK
jgi:membrane protein involved in colicin uptake